MAFSISDRRAKLAPPGSVAMSLVEVARFAGLQEAQIAAARLRSSGYPVLVQNEHWGGADFTMAIAMGGFRVWAPESEAEHAKALVAEWRGTRPEFEPGDEIDPPPSGPPLRSGLRIALAMVLGVLMGGVWALLLVPARRLRRRPALRAAAVATALVGLIYAVWWWFPV